MLFLSPDWLQLGESGAAAPTPVSAVRSKKEEEEGCGRVARHGDAAVNKSSARVYRQMRTSSIASFDFPLLLFLFPFSFLSFVEKKKEERERAKKEGTWRYKLPAHRPACIFIRVYYLYMYSRQGGGQVAQQTVQIRKSYFFFFKYITSTHNEEIKQILPADNWKLSRVCVWIWFKSEPASD